MSRIVASFFHSVCLCGVTMLSPIRGVRNPDSTVHRHAVRLRDVYMMSRISTGCSGYAVKIWKSS